MNPLTEDTDLQSTQTWHTMIDYILNAPHGTTPEASILFRKFQTYKDTLKSGLDIQTQGVNNTGQGMFYPFQERYGRDAEIISVSPVAPGLSPPTTVLFQVDLPLGDAFGLHIKNYWIHIKEINWWGRVASSFSSTNGLIWLDYGPRKYDGNRIPLKVGWHIDMVATVWYTMQGLFGLKQLMRQARGEPLLPTYRIFGPRIITRPQDRFWQSQPHGNRRSGPSRPAVAGMRAVLMRGYIIDVNVGGGSVTNEVTMGPWEQDKYVYEFQGKVWKPKAIMHDTGCFPDVLDSENHDPNFELFDRNSQATTARTLQNYFDHRTFNSILGI